MTHAQKDIELIKKKYTYKKPCCVSDEPDAHTVWLKVENQSFRLDGYFEDAVHADWMRQMLAIAMLNAIKPAVDEATRELKEALEKQKNLLKEWFLNARNENKRMGLNDTWSDSSLWGRTDSTITAAEKLLEK